MRALRIRVRGLVQGVGFRAATVREARRLGIVGHVRNEFDGSVAIHAEGEPAAVESLLAWCGRGPAFARVEAVESEVVAPAGARSFDVTH